MSAGIDQTEEQESTDRGGAADERAVAIPNALPPSTPGDTSACPPPLAWTDVVSEFRQSSEEIAFEQEGRQVSGRVWGTGRPLYFLNGIMGSSEIFCLTLWLLRDDFRCVVLDYDECALGVDDLANGLLLAADELGDGHFALFATSFGTAVALQAMHQAAGRIQHAVLQGPLTGLKLTRLEQWLAGALKSAPGKTRHVPLFRRVLQHNHRLWYPPIDGTRWQLQLSNAGDTPVAAVARRARMLHALDFPEHLQTISTPTLIITSEGETLRHRQAGTVLKEQLPDARHEEIPNSGHVPYVTHPHRLAKLIRRFLITDADG